MDATEIAGQIAEMVKTEVTEVREGIADELARMIDQQAEDEIRDYLDPTQGTSYLPGTDHRTWGLTPEFAQGVRFVIAALRDQKFEY